MRKDNDAKNEQGLSLVKQFAARSNILYFFRSSGKILSVKVMSCAFVNTQMFPEKYTEHGLLSQTMETVRQRELSGASVNTQVFPEKNTAHRLSIADDGNCSAT